MIIGVMTVDLRIDWAESLKDKRSVINRVRDRVHSKFNVSLAEIDEQSVWNYAVLGVAVISNEQKHANQVLSKVQELIESIRECEVEDVNIEFI